MKRNVLIIFLALAVLVSYTMPVCSAAPDAAMPTVVGPDGPIEGMSPPEPDPEEDEEEEEDAPRAGSVKAELLVDYTTGEPIYEFSADKLVYPASTTKIMMALLVCEAAERGDIALDDEVAMTDTAIDALPYDASTVYYQIQPGEYLTVEDYLYCAMLESDCPSCNLLAEYVSGDTDLFVELMNDRAEELGCTDTHFVNPSGYHDDDQYTTARNMYLITAEALRHEEFRKVVGTPQYTVPETNYHSERHLFSTNRLYGAMDISNEGYYEGYGTSYSYDYYYEGASGVKTGTTSAAGSCLVAYAVRGDMELITVVMGGSPSVSESGEVGLTQYVETVRLFDLGFRTLVEKEAKKQEQEQKGQDQSDPEQSEDPGKQEPSGKDGKDGGNGGNSGGNADRGLPSIEKILLVAAAAVAAALIVVVLIYIAANRPRKR
ncbi:MAG: D-alanyl-D-alanine carboxypeptidase [Oscillospiraceae bacterium]|nr:D-alanyl-D-alanine carboxypeptidase [Oscillospiraceae bacterium]